MEAWFSVVNVMAEDLCQLQLYHSAPAIVQNADSRNISKSLIANSVDAVITSPPYPNEKDYTRTTRLESELTRSWEFSTYARVVEMPLQHNS